jgi:hypothetical protein
MGCPFVFPVDLVKTCHYLNALTQTLSKPAPESAGTVIALDLAWRPGLVHLVYLVCLVHFVRFVQLKNQTNKTNQINKAGQSDHPQMGYC